MKYLLPSGGWLVGTVLLVVLALFFIGLVFWVYRRRSGEIYNRLAFLPLRDEELDAEERIAHG